MLKLLKWLLIHYLTIRKIINKGLPLNIMYWSKNGDKYELLDGQQSTLSICSCKKRITKYIDTIK
jgi:hypothetical protein